MLHEMGHRVNDKEVVAHCSLDDLAHRFTQIVEVSIWRSWCGAHTVLAWGYLPFTRLDEPATATCVRCQARGGPP